MSFLECISNGVLNNVLICSIPDYIEWPTGCEPLY